MPSGVGASGDRCWRPRLYARTCRAVGAVEIHLLCHRGDHLCAIWALKTLYLTSGVRWPAVVHVQGACHARDDATLPSSCPRCATDRTARGGCAVWRPALAANYPRLVEARRQSPFMMKLIDPVLLAGAERIVILDSDVLFFREPYELRAHVERAPAETWVFQQRSDQHLQRHRRVRRRRLASVFPNASTAASRSFREHSSISISASACSSIRTCAGPADGSSRRCSRSVRRGARPCRIPVTVVCDFARSWPRLRWRSRRATSPDPAVRCSPKKACRTPRFSGYLGCASHG